MADALALTEGGRENEGENTKLVMPHRVYDDAALNYLFPPLTVVEPVDDEEDVPDSLLQKGLEVANRIVKEAKDHGRRRRPQE